jgi:hypothetical protein
MEDEAVSPVLSPSCNYRVQMERARAFGNVGMPMPFVGAYRAHSCELGKAKDKRERFNSLAVAAFPMRNVRVAFVHGIVLQHINRRGGLRR